MSSFKLTVCVSEWTRATLAPRRMGTSAVGSGGVRVGIELARKLGDLISFACIVVGSQLTA